MKFLFVGQGYPIAGIPESDSGIGKYLQELCLALIAGGNECHVIIWDEAGYRLLVNGYREGEASETLPNNHKQITHDYSPQLIEGVKVFRLARAYWPIVERFMPDSRDVWNLRRMVRLLDRAHHYDCIEIQSEEGIAVGVLRDYPEKCVLRIHTTLADMVRDKQVRRDHKVRYRMAREGRSFGLARRVVVSSSFHANCLVAQFPFMLPPIVVPLGYDEPFSGPFTYTAAGEGGVTSDGVTRDASNGANMRGVTCLAGKGERRRLDAQGNPIILVVGSPDRRKGFDRLMPVFRAFVEQHSPCTVRLVSRCPEPLRRQFGLCPPYPEGLSIEWYESLPRQDLIRLYAEASVLLQLSRYESFGWPVVESASLGTPVVSTAVGTAPELLDGALSEFLVDGDAPTACAIVLKRAIQGRERVSPLLRQRYLDRYTRSAMIKRYLEVVTD